MDKDEFCKYLGIGPASPSEVERFQVPENPGGALLLAYTKLCDVYTHRKESRFSVTLSFVFALGMHVASLVIQLGLMFLVYAYPVEQVEDPFEVGLHEAVQALQASISSSPPLELDRQDPTQGRAHQLCLADHTIMYTQSLMIFLWVVKMTPPIMTNFWAVWSFVQLPKVPAGSETPLFFTDGGSTVITHLRAGSTVVAFLFIMPELLVNVVVLAVGMKFLVYCPSLMDLILKSMSFFFFTQIDETIYAGLTSKRAKATLSSCVMQWAAPPQIRARKQMWNDFGSTIFRTALSLAVVLTYTQVVHSELRDFRVACFEYKKIFNPSCVGKDASCGLHLFGQVFVQV